MNRQQLEQERFLKMSLIEQEIFAQGFKVIAGVDEAGRGPLAGPVVAAACILGEKPILGLNDSKKISAKKREELYRKIILEARSYSVSILSAQRIDLINILNATKEAMIDSIHKLCLIPDYVIIDAVHLEELKIPSLSVLQGDAKSNSIAAASIIAKVTRDQIMRDYDAVYPGYGFAKHKGYGTKEHYAALHEIGPCVIHRKSFLRSFYFGRN